MEQLPEKEFDEIGSTYSCVSCGAVIKVPVDKKPARCSCGKSANFEFLKTERYTKLQHDEATKFFESDNLLDKIKEIISEDHIGDNNLKMTLFLSEVSGLLTDPTKRVSCAITGESSGGKDNVMRSTLKHIPQDKFLFVTSATQASIEDDIHGKNIIVLSELNSNRENGANKNLIEVIKQKTEGGTSSIKKDLRDGMKTSRHEVGEQGTVIFSTTESQMDDEMKTRFLSLGMKSTKAKIKKVNDNTIDRVSNIDGFLDNIDRGDSIIRIGLTGLCQGFDKVYILLPYFKYLKDFKWMDDADPRSQRDLKRVISLTMAMTFLKSLCRKPCQKNPVKIIESVPQDLIDTLEISQEFFNQSYTGLDKRLSIIIDFISNHSDEWVERGEIQKETGIKALNTFKPHLEQLAMSGGGMGLIEGRSGSSLINQYPTGAYHSQKLYYRRCQNPIKTSLILCQLNELKEYLDNKVEEEKKNLSVKEQKDGLVEVPIPKIDKVSLIGFKESGKVDDFFDKMRSDSKSEGLL